MGSQIKVWNINEVSKGTIKRKVVRGQGDHFFPIEIQFCFLLKKRKGKEIEFYLIQHFI